MRTRNVIHKGLRRFIEHDDTSGIPPSVVEKIRRMISFLQDMESEKELQTVPNWNAHILSGDRKNTWSLFVTKNWRMTFHVDAKEIEIVDLNYEDYHEEVAMSALTGIRLKTPTHPGEFISCEIIEPLGLSVTAAAKVLGVTRATLSTLLNKRARLSPEMALRLEKAFGVSMDTLMRMQNSYDIAQARSREDEIHVAAYRCPSPLLSAKSEG